MRLKLVMLVTGLLALAGCGGATFSSDDDATEGSGGSGGDAGSGAGGASSGSGGVSAAASTTGGTGGSGGKPLASSTSGNAVSTDGATSTASTTGGPNCLGVSCEPPPPCVGGTLIVPAGECCPVCACTGALCAVPVCDDGAMPIYEAGNCCPTCPVSSCAGVECRPVSACSDGYYYGRPLGACCSDCVPDPASVACPELVCTEPMCPPGYVSAETQGGCCNDCVPDPLYCNSDADCTIADRPRSCCGCPEAISFRMLTEDLCWSRVDEPRAIPDDCYPDFVCDAECGACELPGQPGCVNHRCTESR